MNSSTVMGVFNGEESEIIYQAGFNGTGAEKTPGDWVCWSATASDGRTFVSPVVGSVGNMAMCAGFLRDTVGTAEYTASIIAHGPGTARVYGIANNFVPGVNLVLVDGKDYAAYGTAGQFAGSAAAQQPIRITAFGTQSTAQETDGKVFLGGL